MSDDTWKLKFRILRQRILEQQIEINSLSRAMYNSGLAQAVIQLDEMLGQSEEERLK